MYLFNVNFIYLFTNLYGTLQLLQAALSSKLLLILIIITQYLYHYYCITAIKSLLLLLLLLLCHPSTTLNSMLRCSIKGKPNLQTYVTITSSITKTISSIRTRTGSHHRTRTQNTHKTTKHKERIIQRQ